MTSFVQDNSTILRHIKLCLKSTCGIEETVDVLLASYRQHNTLDGETKLLDRMFEDWHFIRYDLRDAKSVLAALLERRGWKLDKSRLPLPPGGRGGENELKAIQADVGSLKNTLTRLGEQMMREHEKNVNYDLEKHSIKAERILGRQNWTRTGLFYDAMIHFARVAS
ncbi:hypothetical protein B0H63DRAFT_456263 [Podospora didyma]|uniref:Uncharacterized protein n=1 Tax=Podospora didyma TaxID=330526 RepID=A0AAE0JYZ8_9PEZI|nr:hypothetical protein B0H63DRAFT_456263 [Podospora didyma]